MMCSYHSFAVIYYSLCICLFFIRYIFRQIFSWNIEKKHLNILIYNFYVFCMSLFFYILGKDWMLYGLIILSSGYIIAMICCIVCVCVKCVKFLKFRHRQFRNQREIERMSEPIQLDIFS